MSGDNALVFHHHLCSLRHLREVNAFVGRSAPLKCFCNISILPLSFLLILVQSTAHDIGNTDQLTFEHL